MLTIAEESTAWPSVSRPTYLGGLGFSLKWNMGWMNDTLRYMRHEPIHRKYHHDELTFSLIYAFHENFVLPLSHDEVVHGKGSLLGPDARRPVAEVRQPAAACTATCGRTRARSCLFMGSDFGQWNEWNFDTSLQWDLLQWDVAPGPAEVRGRPEPPLPPREGPARGRFRLPRLRVDRLPQPRRQHAELHPPRRRTRGDFLVVCLQLHARAAASAIAWACPKQCWYEEIFNSDSTFYGGSNLGNGPGVMAEPQREPRPAGLDPHHPAAAGHRGLQAAAVVDNGTQEPVHRRH